MELFSIQGLLISAQMSVYSFLNKMSNTLKYYSGLYKSNFKKLNIFNMKESNFWFKQEVKLHLTIYLTDLSTIYLSRLYKHNIY